MLRAENLLSIFAVVVAFAAESTPCTRTPQVKNNTEGVWRFSVLTFSIRGDRSNDTVVPSYANRRQTPPRGTEQHDNDGITLHRGVHLGAPRRVQQKLLVSKHLQNDNVIVHSQTDTKKTQKRRLRLLNLHEHGTHSYEISRTNQSHLRFGRRGRGSSALPARRPPPLRLRRVPALLSLRTRGRCRRRRRHRDGRGYVRTNLFGRRRGTRRRSSGSRGGSRGRSGGAALGRVTLLGTSAAAPAAAAGRSAAWAGATATGRTAPAGATPSSDATTHVGGGGPAPTAALASCCLGFLQVARCKVE